MLSLRYIKRLATSLAVKGLGRALGYSRGGYARPLPAGSMASVVLPGYAAFKVPASQTEPPFVAVVERGQVLAINPAADGTWSLDEVPATREQMQRALALLVRNGGAQ